MAFLCISIKIVATFAISPESTIVHISYYIVCLSAEAAYKQDFVNEVHSVDSRNREYALPIKI